MSEKKKTGCLTAILVPVSLLGFPLLFAVCGLCLLGGALWAWATETPEERRQRIERARYTEELMRGKGPRLW
jgi:hypothetical protein